MAYAAITCLMRTIHQSMELTGCDLQPFYEKLDSLRAILEKSCNITSDLEALMSLEAEIAEVAYNAEDMVDLKSIKVSFAETAITRSRGFWKICCYLEQEVERIDSFMVQWLALWNWYSNIKDLKVQKFSVASIPKHTVEQPENIMVGHENEFQMMQDQLAGGERELEVVSIVGMGGIGKTTLATRLYGDPRIMSHFDIRVKATVCQEYCVRNVLLFLLSSISGKTDESLESQEEGELADRLQKLLKVKRYLVVIDDIWTTRAWDDIQLCFPDCNNGSRILLTTRNVEVAEYASSGKPPYHMRLLNFDESWNLLHRKVFEKECSSPDFEKIGKQITLNCGGLPLAITVISGLLSKISKTLDEWQSVAENVSSVVSTDLEAQCMRVLALSFHHLPSHLKPCFLYFAIFPEDRLIFVDKFVELWAVEGFLKVDEIKNIEEVAETCLNELIDRSLISIHNLSFDGKIKSCVMHDFTRELCMKEARNTNFVKEFAGKSDQHPCAQSMQCSSKSQGRISIHNEGKLARCRNREAHSIVMFDGFDCFVPQLTFKLVRVLDLELSSYQTFPSGILHLIHLRYLALHLYPGLKQYLGSGSEEEVIINIPPLISIMDIPPSISSLCYLQTFILNHLYFYNKGEHPLMLPLEILTMSQLRHLHLDWNYLRYYEPTEKSFVLKNLQYLSGWNPWYCTESFFRLFPNLKKMKILGVEEDFRNLKDLHDFRYLDLLEELEFELVYPNVVDFLLESIAPSTPPDPLRFQKKLITEDDLPLLLLPPPDSFPQNLKNLAFSGAFFLPWKDLSIVGKLPKLESLKLSSDICIGGEWEVAEEGFPLLKFLLLEDLEIRYWRACSDHFPCLERLFLDHCCYLVSIPQEFADITTLALIDIGFCSKSVGNSAKRIQQDIQDNYGGSIEIHIHDTLNLGDDDDDGSGDDDDL